MPVKYDSVDDKSAKKIIKSCVLFTTSCNTSYTVLDYNLYSLGISFTDWGFITTCFNFVGLDNYFDLLTQSFFIKALLNTLYFGIGTVVPTIVLGLGFALLTQTY